MSSQTHNPDALEREDGDAEEDGPVGHGGDVEPVLDGFHLLDQKVEDDADRDRLQDVGEQGDRGEEPEAPDGREEDEGDDERRHVRPRGHREPELGGDKLFKRNLRHTFIGLISFQ